MKATTSSRRSYIVRKHPRPEVKGRGQVEYAAFIAAHKGAVAPKKGRRVK